MTRAIAFLVAAVTVLAACSGDSSDAATSNGLPTLPAVTTTQPAYSQAPDFTVPLVDGTGFSLSEHLANDGRPVFLNLWASWCPPCRAEMPAIDAASQRHPNVLFIGIAVQDDPVAAEEFAAEVGVSYPLGIDERDLVDSAFGPLGLPTSYLISGEGVILTEVIGEVDEERIDGVLATFLGG